MRQLFKRLARKAPAVLFIDEVDSLLAKRAGGDAAGGSGTSRRVANEFLSFIDGIQTTTHQTTSSSSSSSSSNGDPSSGHQDGSVGSTTATSSTSSSSNSSGIVVMAATNAPWDLDEAALSRFAARVLVPLPGVEAREAILRKAMEGVAAGLSSAQWRQVAERAAGYSGRDLVQVCRWVGGVGRGKGRGELYWSCCVCDLHNRTWIVVVVVASNYKANWSRGPEWQRHCCIPQPRGLSHSGHMPQPPTVPRLPLTYPCPPPPPPPTTRREASMRPVRELCGNRVLTGSHAEQIWAAQRARLIASLVRALDAGSSSKDLRKQLAAWHAAQQVGWCTPEELLSEAQGLLKQQRAAAAEQRKAEAAAAKQARAAEQAARRLQQQQQQAVAASVSSSPPKPGGGPHPAAAAGVGSPARACRQLPPGSSSSSSAAPLQPPGAGGKCPSSSNPAGQSARPPEASSSRAGPASAITAATTTSSSRSSPDVGPVTVALSVQQESGRVMMHLGLPPPCAATTHPSSATPSGDPPCTNSTTTHSGASHSHSAGAGSDSRRGGDSNSTSSSTSSSSRVTVQLAVSDAGRVSVVFGGGASGQCHAASAGGAQNTTTPAPGNTTSANSSSSSDVAEEAGTSQGAAAAAGAGGGQAGALQLVSHDLHLDQEEVDWSDSDTEVDQAAAAGDAGPAAGSSSAPSAEAGSTPNTSSSTGGGTEKDKVRTLRDLLTLPPEAIRAVTYEDFDWALQHVASTDFDATGRYQEWAQQYGAGGGALTTQAGWKFMPMYL